ncbi:hypothetical protein [Haladaptatus caseinilyticus]|uniref:hypothetical protein n=1 Tax=Haladaptatus caseinilyticus TaxID=2993314 RepID=UPI00224B0C90|nr:hypothetical protein [Haladaptatus caseinilyticus]
MMDEIDDVGFVAMSVLPVLAVMGLASFDIVLGVFLFVGVVTGIVRYRQGQKWLAFGCVLLSASVSSLPFISSRPLVIVVFFGGVVVSLVILVFGQLGLIERLSLPSLHGRRR